MSSAEAPRTRGLVPCQQSVGPGLCPWGFTLHWQSKPESAKALFGQTCLSELGGRWGGHPWVTASVVEGLGMGGLSFVCLERHPSLHDLQHSYACSFCLLNLGISYPPVKSCANSWVSALQHQEFFFYILFLYLLKGHISEFCLKKFPLCSYVAALALGN